MISLAGQRILITGGTRGIGKAAAELCRRAGAEVVAVSRSTHGDLSDPAVVSRVFEAGGALSGVVINHGVWPPEDVPLAKLSEAQWRHTLSQNLDSVFLVAREAARRVGDGGSIVLVASTAGQRGEPYHADYAASKGAIIALTKSLAVELAPRVRVNCVAPGWVDTEMCARPFDEGGRERIAAAIPMGRVAAPQDIAGPILFLCSDLARHITGQVISVNGGSVLCG
jgi:3-oxoacyl-[acyl-carrier protein] reductase